MWCTDDHMGRSLRSHALRCLGRVEECLSSAAEPFELLMLKRATEQTCAATQSLGYSRDAAAACWERLHQERWRDVSVVWRDAYAAAGILQAVALLRIGGPINEAVRCADLVLVMRGDLEIGGGIPPLSKLVQDLHDMCQAPAPRPRKRPRPSAQSNVSALPACSPLALPIRRLTLPSMQWFLQHAMVAAHPVIVRGAMDGWPAMGCKRSNAGGMGWSNLEYLRRVAGQRTVPVEVGSHYMDKSWTQRMVKLEAFIDHVIDASSCECSAEERKNLAYLAQHRLFDQVPALRDDISIPDYCSLMLRQTGKQDEHCDENEEDVQINAWFGPAGTVSNLHFDPQHNLLSQVVGSKYVRMYDPKYTGHLYPHDGIMSNTSRIIDVEGREPGTRDVDFPLYAATPFLECVLRPGEMLYIPPGYWHYVRSLEVSFSVSFWWS